MNHFRLEQANDGLGQRVVVRITATADGRFDARVGEAFGVPNGQILNGAWTMAVSIQRHTL
jgi:hypothetical protein